MMNSLDWNEKSIQIGRNSYRTFVLQTTSSSLPKVAVKQRRCLMNSTKWKNIGLQINRTMTQFMKNLWCEDKPVELDGFLNTTTTTYEHLGRSVNMENNMKGMGLVCVTMLEADCYHGRQLRREAIAN
ncbi:hypothetical protein KIN20_038211 [Parelaphostrongylus tenuis]|uniref:Uncharacterized protein n=1 Tax=Parelaphostrongylus tenuis TaxID=148309 RepID=A0AAD5WME1_PARTN|nr:hypothetical protein KIN20_038211 [Parelaphostrongylus tenuis]